MKVLIVTNHFYPEVFRVNDVAFDLATKGNEVTVITCIPNYPIGHFFEGYGLFKNRKEIIKGVTVLRVPVIPRGEGKGIRLFFNLLPFILHLLSFLYCCSKLLQKTNIILKEQA